MSSAATLPALTRNYELEQLARSAVEQALALGATGAEATAAQGDEFEVSVRLGEIETLKEAGSRAIGLRVLFGQRAGSAYTSDLTEAGMRRMVESAVGLARISTEDPYAGLPASEELGRIPSDLDLYSESIDAVPAAMRIELAKRAEQAALAADARITNSEGASYSSHTGWRVFANSHGFCSSYRTSSCSLSVVPVVQENGKLERDFWGHSARRFDALESPELIGAKAAARVLRRLGARKAPTCKAPVVLDARVARSLLGHLFSAVAGESIYRQASFLAGSLGQRVAAACVNIVDDATLPGHFGTSPFDDEGTVSRRTPVVSHGVLHSYLLNTYAARKLGARATGNASRGLTGNAGTGPGNLYLEPGSATPEELIAGVKTGLYVTELLGSGVNIVNGDYSRGAAGLWIENGQLAYPVHEITIAGNLRRMLEQVEAVANDLEFRGAVASPTILIGEMTVSGT
jgi:PmbA protein